jgi:uncharacterized protein (TIGR03084 family)|nr:hypothetical protein [Aeromicrobium sp.]
MTTPIVESLVADLRAEKAVLTDLLAGQPEQAWSTDTPADGWTVSDQIAHLAHFDWVTRICISEPRVFEQMRDDLPDLQTYVDEIGPQHRGRSGVDVLEWWSSENTMLTTAALLADPAARVPWFGPAMSLPSKITARIMETWAHGQDVVDALGLVRPPSSRLKHVARIGVLAFANSFRTRGLDVPDAGVRVSLQDPTGPDTWTWGDPAASDSITGPAEDFCLVVTQRRHVADTRLEVVGDVATTWMTVAQAFAGPAGKGRRPGQFGAPTEAAR